MKVYPAGSTVRYEITWLEMTSPPRSKARELPQGESVHLIECREPPAWWFLSLYDAVGRDYAWDDMQELASEEVIGFLRSPDMLLGAMIRDGWPQGFYLLDSRKQGLCELAYFGLVPEAVGRGLGSWLLSAAIQRGWSQWEVSKLTVNTCSLDHPRAIGLYVNSGFTPIRTESRERVLKRDYRSACRERSNNARLTRISSA